MGGSIAKVVAVVAVTTLVVLSAVVVATLQSDQEAQEHSLTHYGHVTALNYLGTTLSLSFTASADISLYTAAISYTANNHADSEQSYSTPQMPLGPSPAYTLEAGESLNMTFRDIPAGSLLLDVVIQVNATVGAQRNTVLSYEISSLETNSSG